MSGSPENYISLNTSRSLRRQAWRVWAIGAAVVTAALLVLGWGSTYGAIKGAVRRVRKRGGKVARAHLRHLNPLPRNTGDVVRAYRKLLIPETNTGQLVKLIRAEFLVDAGSYTKVEGLPILAAELEDVIWGELQ